MVYGLPVDHESAWMVVEKITIDVTHMHQSLGPGFGLGASMGQFPESSDSFQVPAASKKTDGGFKSFTVRVCGQGGAVRGHEEKDRSREEKE